MRRFAITLGTVSILAVLVAYVTARSRAQEAEQPIKVAGGNLFDGKPVLVDVADTGTHYLVSARLEVIGGKNYFAGSYANVANASLPGKTVRILQDSATTIVVFDTMKEMKTFAESVEE